MSIGADAAAVGLPARRPVPPRAAAVLRRLPPTKRELYLALIAVVAGMVVLGVSGQTAGRGAAAQATVECTIGLPGYAPLRGTGLRGTGSQTCRATLPAAATRPRRSYGLTVGGCTIAVARSGDVRATCTGAAPA